MARLDADDYCTKILSPNEVMHMSNPNVGLIALIILR